MRIVSTSITALALALTATASAEGPAREPPSDSPPPRAVELLGACRAALAATPATAHAPQCIPGPSGAYGACVHVSDAHVVDVEYCDRRGAPAEATGPAYVCAVRWTPFWRLGTGTLALPPRAGHRPPDALERAKHAATCFQ